MGLCINTSSAEARARAVKIDRSLQKLKMCTEYLTTILLLGPGESGKSTIFKQMKLLQDNGGNFSEEEIIRFRPIVYSNCISQMRILVEAVLSHEMNFASPQNSKYAQELLELPNAHWSPEIGNGIKSLWNDSAIQNVYKLRDREFQLNDTADYFFSQVDRFIKDDYVPTVKDVLRARVRSTGIEEAEFVFDKMIIRVVDVGGQRSERRKWIHCFSSVTCILFCASLSGYCQTLREKK